MIRGQQRHAPLAHPVEHQERRTAASGHHRLARLFGHLDLAHPAAPGLRAVGKPLVRILQPRGHRVPLAKLGNLRQEGRLDHAGRGPPRQDLGQGRAVERGRRGIVGPRGQQERATVLDVAADVVDVEHRQDAAALVAVEDDQVEVIDRLHEQLARGKGDQREFRHRHAVLLVRRAQDGEMDEVDRRIGFQQVPPGPLPRMRLARHQQHRQPIADAVDLDDGGVVALGQLSRRFGDDELHDVLACVFQGQRQLQGLVRRNLEAARRPAVDGDGDLGPAREVRGHGPLVLDPERHHQLFADDAEGRRGLDHQPPVPVGLAPRDQRMKRRGQVGHQLRIMQLPVGDKDRPGYARPRLLGQHAVQFRHQQRARVVGRIRDGRQPHLHPQRGDLGLQRLERVGCLVGPVGDALACGLVGHDKHDVRQRLALFRLQRGVQQRRQQRRPRQQAEGPAGQTAPDRKRHDQQRRST